ncbi:MAG: protein tyrosine phosphatase (PTP) superfamily phosphohydrolase (DUF442 family) [Limisphaerales bacterium]|jgi:protein tyrosine phosphatase (PTP) superfamily phosphohydrolase (DUF442 family)
MKHSMPFLLVTYILLATAAQAAENPPAKPLQITATITLAGLLAEGAIPSLKAEDVLVIDLRTAEEGIQSEADTLKAAQIQYINIPMGSTPLERTTVERFSKLIGENSERKILVHCSSGNRAGVIWAAHLMEHGSTAADALEKVLQVVTKEPARQAIIGYGERYHN